MNISQAMNASGRAFRSKYFDFIRPVFLPPAWTMKGYAVNTELICLKKNTDSNMHAVIIAVSESETDRAAANISDIRTLVHNYQNFLMGCCRILTHGNRHDANDLFSRVMLKVCSEGPDQLQRVRHLGGWLSRIAYHQFIDDQRERQANARRDDGLSYLYETIGLSALSPEQEYLNNELKLQLRAAFKALPARLRRAAYMRFYEEASYEEIAASLAISAANARKYIQEARKLLGARVRSYIGEDAAPPRAALLRAPAALQCHPDQPAIRPIPWEAA